MRDRRLQHIGATSAEGHRPIERGPAPLDLLVIPERSILIGQQDQLALREPRLAPRVVRQHQREQPVHLRLVRHQLGQRAVDADRLRGEVAAAPVALVEDQIDHRQHRGEPVGQEVGRGYAERDPGGLDLVLRADQPLRHRLLRDEEGAGDLLGGQAAERPEGQRDLAVERQRRVAAGEEQLEPLVGNRRLIHFVLHRLRNVEQARLLGEGAVAPDPVDGPVARGRHQPGPRVVGRPLARPALRRDRERLLSGLLGQLEAAEEADQVGEDPAPLVSEDLLEDR